MRENQNLFEELNSLLLARTLAGVSSENASEVADLWERLAISSPEAVADLLLALGMSASDAVVFEALSADLRTGLCKGLAELLRVKTTR